MINRVDAANVYPHGYLAQDQAALLTKFFLAFGETTTAQDLPAIGALGFDPGDGDDAGDGEADSGVNEGGEIGVTPDADAGAESGAGEPSASTPETLPEASSSSSTTGTPATEIPPGQVIQWEADDPALSPPQSTPTAVTHSWMDSAIDYFDAGAVDLSAATAQGMPSVGSVIRTIVSGAGAVIAVGGIIAAAFFASTYGRHHGSGGRRGDDHGSHDSDPSLAVLTDSNGNGSTVLAHSGTLPDPGIAATPAAALTLRMESAMPRSAPLILLEHPDILIPAIRDLLTLWHTIGSEAISANVAAAPALSEKFPEGVDFVSTTGVPAVEWSMA